MNEPYDYDETVDVFSSSILFVLFISKVPGDLFRDVVKEAVQKNFPEAMNQSPQLETLVRIYKKSLSEKIIHLKYKCQSRNINAFFLSVKIFLYAINSRFNLCKESFSGVLDKYLHQTI